LTGIYCIAIEGFRLGFYSNFCLFIDDCLLALEARDYEGAQALEIS
jgi:hypothetical protein